MRKKSSTNFENEQTIRNYCNAYKTLSLISGRWKLSILFALSEHECSYSEFKNIFPISDRILSLQLKELQEDLLISKRKDKQAYLLSEKGIRLQTLLDSLSDWGKAEL